MRGLFITFEGVEGAGKTTQIQLLRQTLESTGRRVLATRCPGGDAVAEEIRDVLLKADSPVEPHAELLLFLAARSQVTARVIRPQLEDGVIVLMDRYIDSTTVYQGHARGIDLKAVRQMNLFATGGLQPDLTMVLDLDPERGLARQMDRNRMEAESLEFHRMVRAGYLAEAAEYPDRIRILDGSQTAEALQKEIFAMLEPLLSAFSL
ncbi:MAG: dTMP kinase [Chthonomonadales bacterium]